MTARRTRAILAIAAIALAVGMPRVQGAEILAIRGATVHPVARGPEGGATVLVRDGRIAAAGREVPVPDGAMVIDGKGLHVTPGLIDAGTWAPLEPAAHEDSREDAIGFRVEDGIEPRHRWLRRALLQGTTCAAVTPDNAPVIGGLAAVLRIEPEGVALLRAEAALKVAMTGEATTGNMSPRWSVPASYRYRRPTTRMGIIWLLRRRLLEARGGGALQKAEDLTWPRPDAPSDLAPLRASERAILRRVLDGRLPLRAEAHLESDILAILRVAKEYGIERVTIDGAYEAAGTVEALRAAGARVIVGPHFERPVGYVEAREADRYRWDLAARLARAGIPFAFRTGPRPYGIGGVRAQALHAVRAGLKPAAALRALTLGAAEILGVAGRVGSIEPGKDADLVIWTGPPLEWTSRPRWVITGGRAVDADREGRAPGDGDEGRSNG